MALKLHESFVIHSGPWLREQVIKPYGMTVTSAANHLQVTKSALTQTLDGNARLTPLMATLFEKVFGISAATVLRMQLSHNLTKAKLKESSISISRVPSLTN